MKLKIPSKQEVETFELPYSLNSDFAAPLIEIGKCKKCGGPLVINIMDLNLKH